VEVRTLCRNNTLSTPGPPPAHPLLPAHHNIAQHSTSSTLYTPQNCINDSVRRGKRGKQEEEGAEAGRAGAPPGLCFMY